MTQNILCVLFKLTSTNIFVERISVTSTIDALLSFLEQAGYDGDIAINITNPPVECNGGFWLRNNDSLGFKNTLSFLLSTFHANKTEKFGALNDQILTGSSSTRTVVLIM